MKNQIQVSIYIFNVSRNVRTIFVEKFTVLCVKLVRLREGATSVSRLEIIPNRVLES